MAKTRGIQWADIANTNVGRMNAHKVADVWPTKGQTRAPLRIILGNKQPAIGQGYGGQFGAVRFDRGTMSKIGNRFS